MNKLEALLSVGKYTRTTGEALKNKGYYKMKNGATEVIKIFEGNNTVKTETVKKGVDGGWITQRRMEYGDGKVVSYTTKTNRNGSLNSINLVEKNANGKITKEIRQNSDSFKATIPRVKVENGEVVKHVERYSSNPSSVDVIKPDESLQKRLIRDAASSFECLG